MNKFNFPQFKFYTGREIKAIRQTLRDSRARFARRFLLDFETVKAWENDTNPRKPTGPANVILQELEKFTRDIKTEQARVLSSIRRQNFIIPPGGGLQLRLDGGADIVDSQCRVVQKTAIPG